MNNKLIISVAGSGKTTYLVTQALQISEGQVLITTYTEANERGIREKFLEINGSIPANITIQTWFSFLLQHGVRPYQGVLLDEQVKGMLFVNSASGVSPIPNAKGIKLPYAEDKAFLKHYFTPGMKIYSDKLSKFVYRCNEKSDGKVISRLSRIYTHLFVDEVQDLAGYDLELLALIFKSHIKTLLVGDPRQVTYLTHQEKKNNAYKNGNIKKFILERCKNDCEVDEETLGHSHRNHRLICTFSSKFYPEFPESKPCGCPTCRQELDAHSGIFVIDNSHVEDYIKTYRPTILRHQLAIEPEWNFGNCKGLGFDRVLIYPTKVMMGYLRDGKLKKLIKGKETNAFDIPKFYVAVTRARYSVAISCDETTGEFIEGVTIWSP